MVIFFDSFRPLFVAFTNSLVSPLLCYHLAILYHIKQYSFRNNRVSLRFGALFWSFAWCRSVSSRCRLSFVSSRARLWSSFRSFFFEAYLFQVSLRSYLQAIRLKWPKNDSNPPRSGCRYRVGFNSRTVSPSLVLARCPLVSLSLLRFISDKRDRERENLDVRRRACVRAMHLDRYS